MELNLTTATLIGAFKDTDDIISPGILDSIPRGFFDRHKSIAYISHNGQVVANPRYSDEKMSSNKFTSQITFAVVDNGKTYKIKVFRNGSFQVPGYDSVDTERLHGLLETIASALSEMLCIDTPEVDRIETVMMNFCGSLTMDKSVRLDTDSIQERLKDSTVFEPYVYPDRDFCLALKVHDYAMTVKLFKSGKVNLTNCKNLEECKKIKAELDKLILPDDLVHISILSNTKWSQRNSL